MMRLARIVDDHVQMEEEIIFVTVEEMSDERLSELGSQLQRRKDELLEEGDIIPDEESASR
jgi:hemerythrin superfamily protein